jgi:predicted transcriptional regulator
MTADVITVRAKDEIGRARDLILGLGVHALPVVDDEMVVGIVTSADLVEEWPSDDLVETMMMHSVRLIDVHATATEAAEVMRSERIHHLVVVEGATPVGILSTFDLLKVLTDAE